MFHLSDLSQLYGWVGWFMMFNATFNNISVISWQSLLLVEETQALVSYIYLFTIYVYP